MVSLIARREISAKVRDKGFLLSTAFILVVILGSAVLPSLFGGESFYTVGLTRAAAELEQPLAAEADRRGVELSTRILDTPRDGQAAVAAGDVDAVLDTGTVTVDSSLDTELQEVLDATVASVVATDRLADAGIDPEQVTAAFDVAPLDVVRLDPDAERDSERQVVAFIGVIVLYSLLVLICQYVAMGVVEEKSSRVVELLLATVKPWQMLAGKVLGLGMLGLIQLVVISVGGFVAATSLDLLTVPGDAVGTIVQVIGWFLLGYAFYAALFAAGASLVSRQEDLQTVVMPMIVLLVTAFVVAIQAVQNPDGLLARITAIMPPISPMVMPVRSAAGSAAWWEIPVAVVLMLLAILAVIRIGGRIYAGALLRTGGRVSIRDALGTKT
ncbi:MAG: ABC transporter permease [Geodermatophilaceae bacterium]|nr:ABC transporter permease [Geodermatophilaceae bacterium]